MRTEALLKCALMMLVVALAVVVTSWVGSENNVARAERGSSAGNWILITSTIQTGESLLYMFNTERQVLLVYAFYRRAGTTRGASRYRGDLEFLAGRHCKWDTLYSQRRLFPHAARRQPLQPGAFAPKQLKKMLSVIDEQ